MLNIYLVAEDPNGGGCAHLVRREPGGGQLGGDAENEDLAGRHHGLACEGQPPLAWPRAQHLDVKQSFRFFFFGGGLFWGHFWNTETFGK